MGHILLYVTARGAEEEVSGLMEEKLLLVRLSRKVTPDMLYFSFFFFFSTACLYQLEFSGLIFFHSFSLSLFSSSEGLQHWFIMLMIN